MTAAPPSLPGPWSPAYTDDFNSLNTNVWTNGLTYGNSNVAADGIFSPKDATVSNGVLTLSGQNQPGVGSDKQTYPLTSGMIQTGGIQGKTAPGFAFEYGYVNVRAKGNVGSGFWSAAYLLPISHQDGYEVDIFENKGIQPTTYFGGYHEHRNGDGNWGSTPLSFDETQSYHDYGVDWEPGSLTFYVDGQEVRSYTGSDVPSQPMYLILNLESGEYGGDTSKALPNDACSIESTSVYQHTPDYYLEGQGVGALANPGPNQLGDPSFELENVHGDNQAAYAFRPSSPSWTFNTESGLAANGSALGNTNAPNGNQVGFLEGRNGQTPGQISQTVNITKAGTYNVTFRAANAINQVQPIQVSVDGNVVTTITPSSSSFTGYATPNLNLTPGLHTITFTATDTTNVKRSFIDTVSLNDPPIAPPPVQNITPPVLSATTQSSTTINLTWTDGGDAATGYLVQFSLDGSNYSTLATLPAGSNSYQAAGLTPNTTYFFEITPNEITGASSHSNVAQVTTFPAPLAAPFAPSNLTGFATSTTSINLNWIPGVGGGTPSGFVVQGSTDGKNFKPVDASPTGPSSCRVIGLNPGTKYYFEVAAINNAGTSALSNIAQVTTTAPPLTTPSSPTGLTASAASSTAVNLNWTPGVGGGAPSGYVIEDSTDGTNFNPVAASPTGSSSAQVTGLNPGTHYEFEVAATNRAGTSAPSNVAQATTNPPPIVAPASPTALTATATSSTAINLNWTIGTGGGAATGFNIAESTDGVHFNNVGTTAAGATSYQVTGLNPSTRYSFEVTASNTAGTSSPSNVAQATTNPPPIVAPASPTALTARATSSTAINLNWTIGTGGGAATGFNIAESTDGVHFNNVGTAPAGATSYQVTGLNPSTRYSFEVAASNTAGTSSPSNVAQATTSPTPLLAPTAPSALIATAVSSTSVNLIWASGSGGGVATSFSIQASTDGKNFNIIATAPAGATSFQVTGLNPSTTYTFRVSAANATGASAPSVTATSATLGKTNPQATSPWMSTDIGNPATAGRAAFSTDLHSITLTGSGTGIQGSADQFQFADQMTSGNLTISAELTSQKATDVGAKSGVMIRASSDPSSAFVAVLKTGGDALSFEWRTASGATKQSLANLPVVGGPVDLKLARVGNTFTGYYSTNGATYSVLGSVTFGMATNTFSGVATSSHNAGTPNIAVFSNVKVALASDAPPSKMTSTGLQSGGSGLGGPSTPTPPSIPSSSSTFGLGGNPVSSANSASDGSKHQGAHGASSHFNHSHDHRHKQTNRQKAKHAKASAHPRGTALERRSHSGSSSGAPVGFPPRAVVDLTASAQGGSPIQIAKA